MYGVHRRLHEGLTEARAMVNKVLQHVVTGGVLPWDTKVCVCERIPCVCVRESLACVKPLCVYVFNCVLITAANAPPPTAGAPLAALAQAAAGLAAAPEAVFTPTPRAPNRTDHQNSPTDRACTVSAA